MRRPASRIVQGYLPTRNGIEIRLRRKGSATCLTIKAGSGRRRQEEEIKIPPSTFRALWPLTRGARISKRRHKIPHRGRTIELDVYAGRHRGLVTAELEVDSMRESRAVQLPDWLGREITGKREFANATLARRDRLPRSVGKR